MQVTQAIVTALLIQTGAGDTRSVVYQRLPLTNIIFSNELLFESRVSTKLQCSVLCLINAGCVTFTFTENSPSWGICRGHSTLHQSSDPQTATANTQYYGMECSGNCQDMRTPQPRSGVRQLCFTRTSLPVSAYCDQNIDGGTWTVIQRRQDGSVNFNLNWTDYQAGFGNPAGEYWLGLKNIHNMTSSQSYEIRFDLQLYNGTTGFAVYRNFSVGPSSDFYRLNVGNMTAGNLTDHFQYNNGMRFSTGNSDNDVWIYNCASFYGGGWWYQSCGGVYMSSPFNSTCDRCICPKWGNFGPHCSNALQKNAMKIRPLSL